MTSLLLLSLLCIPWCLLSFQNDSKDLIFINCILLPLVLIVGFFVIVSRSRSASLRRLPVFNPASVFIIAYIIIDFTPGLIDYLGIASQTSLDRLVQLRLVSDDALRISRIVPTLGLASFFIGFTASKLSNNTLSRALVRLLPSSGISSKAINVMRSLGAFLFLFFFALSGGTSLFTQSYANANNATGVNSLFMDSIRWLSSVMISISFLLQLNQSTRPMLLKNIFSLSGLFYCFVVLYYFLTGNRGEALLFSFPLIYILSLNVKTLFAASLVLTTGIMTAFIAFGFIRLARTLENGVLGSISIVQSFAIQDLLFASLTNFASSGNLIIAAVSSVDKSGFLNGQESLSILFSLIPFSRSVINYSGIYQFTQGSVARLNDTFAFGDHTSVGTSLIASFYIDFGFTSLILGFIAMGLLIGSVCWLYACYPRTNLIITIYAYSLGVCSIAPRYAASLFVKEILYLCILLIVLCNLFPIKPKSLVGSRQYR